MGSTQLSHNSGELRKNGLQGVKNAAQKEQQTRCQSESSVAGSAKSKTISGKGPSDITGGFTMNTPKTIEEIRKQMSPTGQAYFDSQIAAGGGVEGQRAHLQGTGKKMFITSVQMELRQVIFLQENIPVRRQKKESRIYNYLLKMMRLEFKKLYLRSLLLYWRVIFLLKKSGQRKLVIKQLKA